jgi:hypothetical protein
LAHFAGKNGDADVVGHSTCHRDKGKAAHHKKRSEKRSIPQRWLNRMHHAQRSLNEYDLADLILVFSQTKGRF